MLTVLGAHYIQLLNFRIGYLKADSINLHLALFILKSFLLQACEDRDFTEYKKWKEFFPRRLSDDHLKKSENSLDQYYEGKVTQI